MKSGGTALQYLSAHCLLVPTRCRASASSIELVNAQHEVAAVSVVHSAGESHRSVAIMYGYTYCKSMDQPGKVASPARGLTEKMNISMSAFVPENLVSRDGFGSPVPRQPAHLHTRSWIWCLLTGFLPSSAAASIYSFITAIRPRISPEFIGSRNCVPMAFFA